MPNSVHANRLVPARARMLTAAALLSGVLMAGCGGSSPSPSRTVGDATTSASTVPAPGGATTARPLAFARCMRANGVPDFPDPNPGSGALFAIPAGASAAAPAFRAAQARCRKFLGGGPPGPGSSTHPSAQTLAKLVRIARCMRQHGVPQFPDPRTSVPIGAPSATGFQEITDFDGAILLFPSTMNMESPAYKQALTACGAPPLGLPH